MNEIKNAITINAHFNRNGFSENSSETKKPICLILDEIDGALGGGSDMSKGLGLVADFLNKCIKETDRAKQLTKTIKEYEEWKEEKDEDISGKDSEGQESDEPEWKKRVNAKTKEIKVKFPPLNRPIILVCNDGYAKALYPMKDIVLKLRIRAASSERVNDRLIEILKREGDRDFSNIVRKMIID